MSELSPKELVKHEDIPITLDGAQRTLRTFPRITGTSFQHPDDSRASSALEAVPLFPQVVSFISSNYAEHLARMEHLMDDLRLGPDQGAGLYSKFVLAARILNLPQLPELYLSGDNVVNAYASGIGRPVVTLNRGLLVNLNEAETLAIIGHELGHIKCNHLLNRNIATMFGSAGVTGIMSAFPVVGTAAGLAIQSALSHWSRMAEFSCDRAAMLVVQDPKVVASAMAKLSGLVSHLVPDFNYEGIFRQIEDYQKYDQNSLMAVVKFQNMIQGGMTMSHPNVPFRIKRIFEWGNSDHYEDIMSGVYELEPLSAFSNKPQSDSKKCLTCGSFMPKDAGFCSHCGAKL